MDEFLAAHPPWTAVGITATNKCVLITDAFLSNYHFVLSKV
jgi:hypothetical protein